MTPCISLKLNGKYEISKDFDTLCFHEFFEKLDFDPKLRLFGILYFPDFFEKLDFDPIHETFLCTLRIHRLSETLDFNEKLR